MRYLLDTNIISHMARYPLGQAALSALLHGFEKICTSIIAASEIRFGLENNRQKRHAAQIRLLLDEIDIFPFEPPAGEQYAAIRAALTASGQIIGANDLFIAAHAMALDCTLVTDNMREFSRIEGLKAENWLHA